MEPSHRSSGTTVDKPSPSDYYSPIMASEPIQRRIDRLLDQAEEEKDRSDWESVRGHAKMALGLDPENTDAESVFSWRTMI